MFASSSLLLIAKHNRARCQADNPPIAPSETVESLLFAVAKLYRPLWSDAVHAEWITVVRRDHPDLTEPQIARTRRLMTENVPDAMVTGYETLIDGFKLPDANDRHVLAAAIHGGASVIVTWNLKHFPTKALKPHGVAAQSPDNFLSA